jgi:cytochrome c-type biogenesis protein CcmE
MTQATWEKPRSGQLAPAPVRSDRLKFLIGGILILVAVAYLVFSGMTAGARFYQTIDELVTNPANANRTIRVAGVVLGDTIQYDAQNLILTFTVANVPENFDNLAEALHLAANNPEANRIQVRVEGQVKPDLLRHEAQAILSGKLGADGIFHATELSLKCPTRFEEAQPHGEIVATPLPGA